MDVSTWDIRIPLAVLTVTLGPSVVCKYRTKREGIPKYIKYGGPVKQEVKDESVRKS